MRFHRKYIVLTQADADKNIWRVADKMRSEGEPGTLREIYFRLRGKSFTNEYRKYTKKV